MSLVVIGDVHSKRKEYCQLLDKYEYTVQLGDCDFEYSHLKGYDPDKHKVIPGNHDNHQIVYDDPHCLGRFGHTILNKIPFFFVAGAFSIDKFYRTEYVDWWPNEELSYKEMWDAMHLYEQIKPDLVITHDCPAIVAQTQYGIMDKSITMRGLDQMFEIHKPKMWIYGHWHRNTTVRILGTDFICLNELKAIRI